MLLVRICRKCKKFKIVKNDKTGRDKKLVEEYHAKNLVCDCEN